MKPIRQTVHLIDKEHNQVYVKSGKGTKYPVDLNHYLDDINVGDVAIVTKAISGEWILVDVENKYPYADPLDVTQFPRTDSNDLNIVEYWKYRAEFDKLHSDRERNEMNLFLINLFKDKYGYDALRNVEPQQTSLEAFL